MAFTRITLNGRDYESPEAMPPDVRRAYEEILRLAGPALGDRDGDGVPDIVEGAVGADGTTRVVVDDRIIVNGQSYRGAGEMPADVRRLYEKAMSGVRRGPGIHVSREGPTLSLGISTGSPSGALPGVSDPGAAPGGAARVESSLRAAVFIAGAVVVLALAAWALLGR
jgi:hypothetical protein